MKRLCAVLASLFILTGAAFGQFVIDGVVPRWGVSFEEVHRALSRDLVDPRSAQYKGLMLVRGEDGAALCGWMNWKGSSGGYGPFVAFYYKAIVGGTREVLISELGVSDPMDDRMKAVGCGDGVMSSSL